MNAVQVSSEVKVASPTTKVIIPRHFPSYFNFRRRHENERGRWTDNGETGGSDRFGGA